MGFGGTFFRTFAKPFECLFRIFGHADALAVKVAESAHGIGMPQIGGGLHELECLGAIFLYAITAQERPGLLKQGLGVIRWGLGLIGFFCGCLFRGVEAGACTKEQGNDGAVDGIS